MRKQIVLGSLIFAGFLGGIARADEVLNRALFIAVSDGNLREVQSLIARGADASATYGEIPGDINLKDAGLRANFMTPFSYAVSREHPNQAICLLLAHKVKFDIPWNYTDGTNAGTISSIRFPVKQDNVEVVEILLQRGDGISDSLTLFDSVKSAVMADLLLSHGANVNAKNAEGETALHHMSDYGLDTTIAEWMVAHGADVNIKDNQGRTPLHSAILHSNPKTAEFLLKHGANVNAKDNDGATPLHMLGTIGFEHIGDNTELIDLLLSHGADVNAQDKGSQTPLGRVLATADQNLIKALQAHGGKTNIGQGELLHQATLQFKGHSDNEVLRKAIIDLSLKEHPAPAIPAEAEAAAGRGTYIFKNATSPDEVLSAAKEYLAAIVAAPWVANYYYNLCIVLEKTPYTQQALHACKLYLVAVPDATDASAVRQRIAGLQYAADRDKAQMKQRTRYIKAAGREDLYRFGGISGTVSGRDIVLKLFIDWTAAPPKYQVYVGCSGGPDDMYGDTHDLVSTDTWTTFCKDVVNLHLVIKPEGEGFVEVSDASGGSLRATLDELFTAKQKTMAQAILFSASGEQGDQYYVPYVQGGNDMKHVGFAMFASDCNGNMLKKDPRALPDGFIPGDRFAAGDYGRFHPEVVIGFNVPVTDLCSQQFASKTGYHFGEAE